MFILLILWVDDMGICGTWQVELDRVLASLFSQFKMKNLGAAGTTSAFLGLQLFHRKEGIYMNQGPYIDDLLERVADAATDEKSQPQSYHHTDDHGHDAQHP